MPIMAYKLIASIPDLAEEGKILHLEEEIGKKLVKAGLAEEATAEDMNGSDEDGAEEMADQPMVENAVSKVKELVEKAESEAAEKLAKVLSRQRPEPKHTTTIPAEVKGPTYKSVGAAIRDMIKATVKRDQTAINRVMAYQDECVKAYDKLGIVTKAPSGINEGTNSQGGYLVNPQFSTDVYAIPHGQINLQEQAVGIDAQSLTYNQRFINESSLANGSIFGGLNMVAAAEGAALTSSLPAWNNVSLTLQKEVVFAYYTSEVIEDASYPLEAELNEYADKAFVYGINTQVVQGTTLEGVLNNPGLVTVTHDSNDTAFHTTPSTCLTYADLANMWSRVYPDCQTSPQGMWLFHPSLEVSLNTMTYTFSGSNPAWGITYSAEQGLSGKGPLTPYRIFGKPAYPCWACSAPGNTGDILYVDFATVLHYRRPFRVEVSKDFHFNQDETAVRFVWRGDVKGRFRNAVTGVNGSQTFSAYVTRSAVGT